VLLESSWKQGAPPVVVAAQNRPVEGSWATPGSGVSVEVTGLLKVGGAEEVAAEMCSARVRRGSLSILERRVGV
jgi:hypothetical protein